MIIPQQPTSLMKILYTDTYVPEESIRSGAAEMAKLSRELDDDIKQYLSILRTVLNAGIVSGNTHDSLAAFASAADMLDGKVSAIGASVSNKANAFLSEVDATDGYMY